MKKSTAKETKEILNQRNSFTIEGVVKWCNDKGNCFIINCAFEATKKDGSKYQSYASQTITNYTGVEPEKGDVVVVTGHFSTSKSGDKYYDNLIADSVEEA